MIKHLYLVSCALHICFGATRSGVTCHGTQLGFNSHSGHSNLSGAALGTYTSSYFYCVTTHADTPINRSNSIFSNTFFHSVVIQLTVQPRCGGWWGSLEELKRTTLAVCFIFHLFRLWVLNIIRETLWWSRLITFNRMQLHSNLTIILWLIKFISTINFLCVLLQLSCI